MNNPIFCAKFMLILRLSGSFDFFYFKTPVFRLSGEMLFYNLKMHKLEIFFNFLKILSQLSTLEYISVLVMI